MCSNYECNYKYIEPKHVKSYFKGNSGTLSGLEFFTLSFKLAD